MTIQPEIATLEKLIRDAQETLEKAQQDLKNYQKLVKKGKQTLGSPLENFVFVHHLENREYWRNFYTALADLCTEDQPIMVEYTGTTKELSLIVDDMEKYRNVPYQNHRVGILTDTLQFEFQQGTVMFPVHSQGEKFDSHFKESKLPLKVSADILQQRYSRTPNPHSDTMRIILGDKDAYLQIKDRYTAKDYPLLFGDTAKSKVFDLTSQ